MDAALPPSAQLHYPDTNHSTSLSLPFHGVHTHDSRALLHLIQSFAKRKDLPSIRRIHSHLKHQQSFADDPCASNALVTAYAKCHAIIEAQKLFDELPLRNVVTWNALISGYAQEGLGDEAVSCFRQMRDEGFSPNAVTYVSVLKACGSVKCIELGEEIHAEISKGGLLEKDIVLGTAMVDMYAKCNMMDKAEEVFRKLKDRDIISWNALISGYSHHGFADEALKCFREMQDDGFSPNAVTFVSLLKVCSNAGLLTMGEYLHEEANRRGLLRDNVFVGNALVDMYAKCHMLGRAEEVFRKLRKRDVVCWNAMIAGYVQHGFCDEAVDLYRHMHVDGVCPSAVTFICILKACASVGYVEMGEEIYADANIQQLLEKDVAVGTAVVDMYAKCGLIRKAQEVFDSLPMQNIVSWNALIAGYGQMGQVKRVLELSSKMIAENIVPDFVTSLTLLSAHSHEALVQDGQIIFDDMVSINCHIPNVEHYTCMVDLFGCVGRFDKAVNLIEKVFPSHRLPLWWALLGACCKRVNVEVGRWAFEQSVQLDGNSTPVYVSMRNIYAAAGMHEEAERIESWRTNVNAYMTSDGFVMPSWFDIQEIPITADSPNDEEDLLVAVRKIHEMLNKQVEDGIPADRIFLCGFSQGGALTLASALSYPRKLAGAVVFSGWVPFNETFFEKAREGKQTPLLWLHGTSDQVVHFKAGQVAPTLLANHAIDCEFKAFHGLGHSISPEELAYLNEWMKLRIA